MKTRSFVFLTFVTLFLTGGGFLEAQPSDYKDSCATFYTCRNFYGASGAPFCKAPVSTVSAEKCPASPQGKTAIGRCLLTVEGGMTIEVVYYPPGGGASCSTSAACETQCRQQGGTYSPSYGG